MSESAAEIYEIWGPRSVPAPACEINRRRAAPVYEQLADLLREQICSGEIEPDTRVLSKAELNEQYQRLARHLGQGVRHPAGRGADTHRARPRDVRPLGSINGTACPRKNPGPRSGRPSDANMVRYGS